MSRDYRPTRLSDIVGQDELRRRLDIMVLASVMKNDALPHMIFYGPRGTGKTTFARALANERDVQIVEVTGDSVQKKEDVRSLINRISIDGYRYNFATESWVENGDEIRPTILFVDEIHRMSKEATEALYHPLEDGLHTVVRRNTGKLTTMRLPKFTLIGATTDAGKLLPPLITRVRMMYLEPYSNAQLFAITKTHYQRSFEGNGYGVVFNDDALWSISRRSQGTPRLAVRNLSELVDVAMVEAPGKVIDERWVDKTMMDLMGIDKHGLGSLERRLLLKLSELGRPTGIDAMASYLGESPHNIEAAERYLQEIGALLRGPKGREITDTGRVLLER